MRRCLLLLLAAIALAQGLRTAGWSVSLQVTDSMPRGLYLVRPAAAFARGDVVLLEPPPAVAPLMIGRGWLGAGMKLLKPIAAAAPDEVCLRDRQVYINGRAVAPVFAADRSDRPLPRLDLCRRLAAGEVFLLSTRTPYSFDSRYFGPVETTALAGRAQAL
jgi:conjugative transfer signal peptidase TraF